MNVTETVPSGETAGGLPAATPRAAYGATLGAAGLGLLACLGAGLARSDGAEPWIANALGLGLSAAGLWMRGVRPLDLLRAVRAIGARGADALERETGLAAVAISLGGLHALAWLPLGLRLWPLGLVAGLAAAASVLFHGLAYARREDAPRWSGAPTPLLFLTLAGCGGLLGLSAVENVLGFPPSLVVWKAALAIIGLGLAAQLWTAQAAEAVKAASEAGRLEGPLLDGPAHEATRRAARPLGAAALGLGLGVPILCAVAADFLPGGFWMPVALGAHLAGACVHRRLFLAQAERARPESLQ